MELEQGTESAPMLHAIFSLDQHPKSPISRPPGQTEPYAPELRTLFTLSKRIGKNKNTTPI